MGHRVARKEEGEQVTPPFKKVRHIKLQVVMVPRLSCSPLKEWNTKQICDIKPLEIPDFEANSEPESGPPDEATSPECLDHKPFQQQVPPDATPTNTLCHSGRIRQPPRKVAD